MMLMHQERKQDGFFRQAKKSEVLSSKEPNTGPLQAEVLQTRVLNAVKTHLVSPTAWLLRCQEMLWVYQK